jgi:hypothetical protein
LVNGTTGDASVLNLELWAHMGSSGLDDELRRVRPERPPNLIDHGLLTGVEAGPAGEP